MLTASRKVSVGRTGRGLMRTTGRQFHTQLLLHARTFFIDQQGIEVTQISVPHPCLGLRIVSGLQHDQIF